MTLQIRPFKTDQQALKRPLQCSSGIDSNQSFCLIHRVCKTRVNFLVTPDDLKQHKLSSDRLIEQVNEIVFRNFALGRVQRVKNYSQARTATNSSPINNHSHPPAKTCSNASQYLKSHSFTVYVDTVIRTYLKEHDRVEGLQNKNETEWEQLLKKLTVRAYFVLLRQQIPAARARSEAEDFAHETCHAIYSNVYPYDVPFDAWTARILNNFILQRQTRSRDLIDRKPEAVISLDYPDQTAADNDFSFYDLLTDESSTVAFKRVEMQDWLIQAILRLRSQAQQEVIIYTYFYDLCDEEIANRIEKSKNAVHILRHRALQRLQKILGDGVKETNVKVY